MEFEVKTLSINRVFESKLKHSQEEQKEIFDGFVKSGLEAAVKVLGEIKRFSLEIKDNAIYATSKTYKELVIKITINTGSLKFSVSGIESYNLQELDFDTIAESNFFNSLKYTRNNSMTNEVRIFLNSYKSFYHYRIEEKLEDIQNKIYNHIEDLGFNQLLDSDFEELANYIVENYNHRHFVYDKDKIFTAKSRQLLLKLSGLFNTLHLDIGGICDKMKSDNQQLFSLDQWYNVDKPTKIAYTLFFDTRYSNLIELYNKNG